MSVLSPNNFRSGEKENMKGIDMGSDRRHQMSKQDLVINDLSSYTTKSRKNLANNTSTIIQSNKLENCSSAILQDMNTDDDLL
jgi:hypothetical protein